MVRLRIFRSQEKGWLKVQEIYCIEQYGPDSTGNREELPKPLGHRILAQGYETKSWLRGLSLGELQGF
jgi:hypothetical protein